MNPKVSVIIPVYNAAPYLARCIRSLLKQTLADCEFIFVNDGSTDDSRAIITRYEQLDTRLRLINQENQGVSRARNTGLAAAAGSYVGFVDADDEVAPDMYETLYGTAAAVCCDVVLSNMESELDGHKVITRFPFPHNALLDRSDIEKQLLPWFLRDEQMNTAVNKLYRRHMLSEHSIAFPEKVALGEDGMFNMHFFSCAQSMIYIDYTGYYYREVRGSATRNLLEKDYFARALEVYRTELPDYYKQLMPASEIHLLRSIKLIHQVMSYIHIYFNASDQLSFSQRRRYIARMIAHPDVQQSLSIYSNAKYSELGRYQRLMLHLIRTRQTWALCCAAAYSRTRNRF